MLNERKSTKFGGTCKCCSIFTTELSIYDVIIKIKIIISTLFIIYDPTCLIVHMRKVNKKERWSKFSSTIIMLKNSH